MKENEAKADIRKRTFGFALKVVKMVSFLPKNNLGFTLGGQVLRSGTSVGANVEEGTGSLTVSEFIYHMNLAKKEARETNYWIKLLIDANLVGKEEILPLLQENEEIIKILTSIVKTSQQRKEKVTHNS